MDLILADLANKRQVLFMEITDVDDIAATLYVLNGGPSPQMPLVGDFAYNFTHGTFEVYHPNSWRSFTVTEVESMLRHPKRNTSIVSFTASGIPFWKQMSRGQVTQRCNFSSIDALLSHFRRTFDSRKLSVITLPPAPGLANTERPSDSHSEFGTLHLTLIFFLLVIFIQRETHKAEWEVREVKVSDRVCHFMSSLYSRLKVQTERQRLSGESSKSMANGKDAVSISTIYPLF